MQILLENVAASDEIFCEWFATASLEGHFMAYFTCREIAKLFRFLLSQYSVIGACNMPKTGPLLILQEHFVS
jgi:hypothetical protein